jgi:sec-independent protein translocase protein TatC
MAAPFATAHELPPGDREPDARARLLSIMDHLEAFRRAILRSLIVVAIGIVVAYTFIDRIFAFVLSPAVKLLPPGSKFIYTEPTEAFGLQFNICIIAGLIFASPFIMFQLWRLIAPVLYKEQKKFVIPFVTLTSLGVISGAAFAHYIMFPAMIAFFGTFTTDTLQFMPKIRNTFDLYVKMLMGMTLVFQIPTITFFLAKMGMVTASMLWRYFRYAILIAFIIGAVLTPSPDPWNQTIFATPIIILYLVSIGIAWVINPRGKRKAALANWNWGGSDGDADTDGDRPADEEESESMRD